MEIMIKPTENALEVWERGILRKKFRGLKKKKKNFISNRIYPILGNA